MTNVPINVEIKRNADGLTRVYPFPEYGWDTDMDDYMWSDGNYSCDCNRALFFARAADEDDDIDIQCGESAYSVRIFDLSGKLLYQDGTWG